MAEIPPLARGMVAACLVLLSLSLTAQVEAAPPGSRFDENYFTNAIVETHEGKHVRFYDELIKDKIVVINFIYLTCNDICPLATARLALVRERLGDRVGKDIFLYSITIEPEKDTQPMLQEFAAAFGAGGGWQFLTGRPDDIHLIRWRLGERSRNVYEHRNDLVLGNDSLGEWSRYSLMADIDAIVKTVKELDPAERSKARPTASQDAAPARVGDLRLKSTAGQALFLKTCATCHTIGDGVRFGPDLKDVTQRRPLPWLTSFIVAPEKMHARGDAFAQELRAQFKGLRMPNLGLSERDAEDVMSYIEMQSELHGRAAAGRPKDR